ncbi:MAG: cytochrome-c peroxidase [Nitritalea sp.]
MQQSILRYVALWGTLLLLGFSLQQDPVDFAQLRAWYSQPSSAWPAPHLLEGGTFRELEALPENPFRQDAGNEALITLGKHLFFDPRLSASNQISCASCHDPELSWSNGRSLGIGHDHQQGQRNTPSIQNIWEQEIFFWDGRVEGLEAQSLMPIADHTEMNQELELLPEKLGNIAGYAPLFSAAFGSDRITPERIGEALAMFQRSITGRRSDFDYFMAGRQERMSDEALWGLHLFRTKAHCINCHNGPFFTDQKFHNLGLHFYGRTHQDLGRYEITGNPADVGAFKTPSLRDVAFTAPYMHNGLFPHLEGVINMYDAGMARPKPRPEFAEDPLFPETSELLVKLSLTAAEKQALEAFLKSISAPPFRMARPQLVE